MPISLLDLQRGLRHAIDSGDANGIAPWVDVGAADLAKRVGIYRHNSTTNLCNALRADYPVVERLVGGDFFDHVAATYVSVTPSRSGDIGDYGRNFPQFLAAFPGTESLPYLTDVAMLERAWLDAFLAPEALTIDVSRLANVPPAQLGELGFCLHPSARLVASSHQILRIWAANQPGYGSDEMLQLEPAGDFVLVIRAETEVELHRLDPGEYAWVRSLHAGGTLAQAVDTAFSVDAAFDLGRYLPRHLGIGTFTHFSERNAS